MNSSLAQRLKERQPPFAGETVHSAPLVPVPFVRRALTEAVRVLRPLTGTQRLFRVTDRSATDASTGVAVPTTWNEIESWLHSDQRLFLARSGELDVLTGIYPESYSFYLRFYVDHEILPPGKPLEGRFDLSCDAATAASFVATLTPHELNTTSRGTCSEFFAAV